LFSACSLNAIPFTYQVEVQQGNIITDEMVYQLRPGMTKRQVKFILGTPAIDDPFRENRWDYVYTRAAGGGGKPERLTAIFDEAGNLSELKGNKVPADWPAQG